MFKSITITLIAASAAFSTAALAEVDCERCPTTKTFYCEQSEPAVWWNWRKQSEPGYFTGSVKTAYATFYCGYQTGRSYLISEWRENWVSLIDGEEFGVFCAWSTA